jgi:hypothetical protein
MNRPGAILVALLSTLAANAEDVVQLRTGYWALVTEMPDGSEPQRTLQCLTPYELENMRFFISNIPECTTLPGGQQSRTAYEIDQQCQMGEDTVVVHYRIATPDSLTATVTTSMTLEGQEISVRATARWLQDSCDPADIPIS